MIQVGSDGRLDSECQGELLARERRGELSQQDCLALRAHLADCGSCRMARQVFADLDDASGVDVHDGVRIERMSSAARRWAHQRSRTVEPRWPGRRRLRTLGLAAVAVLIGGTASATVWFWEHPGAIHLDGIGALVGMGPRTAPVIRYGRTPGSNAGGDVASAPAGAVTVVAPPAVFPGGAAEIASAGPNSGSLAAGTAGARLLLQPQRPTPGRGAGHRAVRVAQNALATSPTAADILRQASSARRSGDAGRALRLYRTLRHDYPDSSESLLSSVALGGLLLEQRSPRSALAEFDSYLGSSRGGELIPEALYGRGRALAALGDREEERRTWRRLVADFPSSAYGPWARRRLADLE